MSVAAYAVTIQDVRDAECGVYCTMNSYDGGSYDKTKKVCLCIEEHDYVDVKKKVIKLPKYNKPKPKERSDYPAGFFD